MSAFTPELTLTNTAAEVLERFPDNVKGKYIVITGGYGGLGFESAKQFLKGGAHVIIAGRSQKKHDECLVEIKKEVGEDAKVYNMILDLNSLASVKAFAEAYKAKFSSLNILMNNAGIMACPYAETNDGLESQFGVNHISHFYLTELLMPLLISTPGQSRVINLASLAHWACAPQDVGIRFDDLDAKVWYDQWDRYGAAKLANACHAKGLTKRYPTDQVVCVSVHPGVIMSTGLARHQGFGFIYSFMKLAWRNGLERFRSLNDKAEIKNIPVGASSQVFTALVPELTPGGYYYDNALQTTERVAGKFLDDEKFCDKLWEASEEIVAKITAEFK